MTVPAPGTARTTAAGNATRQRILTAATELFARDGFTRTTVRGIAERAQTDPALIIRYFGSKQELFIAARAPSFPVSLEAQALSDTRPLVRTLLVSLDDQLTRLLDLASLRPGEELPTPAELQSMMHRLIVEPILAQRNTTPGQEARVEATVGLILGAVFVRRRAGGEALATLGIDELTDLLLPAARALLDEDPQTN